MSKVKEFTYTKPDGKVSERYVWELNPITDMLFALDLTEFDQDERDYYISRLEMLNEDMRDAIIEIGLASQYRNFKSERITYADV